jgi:hypothetical protein
MEGERKFGLFFGSVNNRNCEEFCIVGYNAVQSGVISHKIELFITTVFRASNPTI